ncbi:hypothetical protein X756_31535 [Mesorhizobium sp. LSHC412B00]|nr:hypothetical protein X756_31535 [Mesorhizobium sp. LSHC412B00]
MAKLAQYSAELFRELKQLSAADWIPADPQCRRDHS